MQRRFSQVDVFASGGFNGNPVAVVHDAESLLTDDMHRITSWTNLSEATFLVPSSDPAADYRVRIFCPGRELAFVAPRLMRSGPIEPSLLGERLEQLGLTNDDVIDAAWIDNGPGWMGLLLRSVDAVLEVLTPASTIPGFDVGLMALHPPGNECALEVRALFADANGAIREDPVTGSLYASAAQWLLDAGRINAPYVAAQGRVIGRDGRIFVERDASATWIGGHTVVSVSGTIDC